MVSSEDLNVVAVMRSAESGDAFRELCAGMNGTRISVHVADLQDVTPDKKFVNGKDVLFLDIDPRDSNAAGHLKTIIHERFPTTPVVVTAADITIEDIRAIMRLGVVDVLPQPIRQMDLMIALDHAARRPAVQGRAADSRGKIVTFLKGGGGVGATTLATQGGCVLARETGSGDARTCLLDLDIQFGTAGLYLDLNREIGLPDLLESPDRLDRSLLSGVMARHESGLEVLLAPNEVLPLDVVTPDFITNCLKVAAEEYDYVLIDLPPNWTSWTYTALSLSDLIILVTELTVAGVRLTQHQLQTLRAQDLASVPVRIALNRSERGGGFLSRSFGNSANLDDAEKALGRKFDYCVPNNYRLVSEATNQGVMLSKIEKRSKVEKSIRDMIGDVRKSLTELGARPEVQPSD